jgi:23S rRNA pseudouridine2457 synthase
MVPRYYILHKPYGYLCQFTGEKSDLLLADLFVFPKDVYAVGRLDKDSEGLLLLTNDNNFKTKVLHPSLKHSKTYHVQVEGKVTNEAIAQLQNGSLAIKHNGKSHTVAKAQCRILESIQVEDRVPPIRFRAEIPTTWLELTITEGKNRQVRKMTAAAGFPTLRLIRVAIGEIRLDALPIGKVKEIDFSTAQQALVKIEF